MTERRSTQAQEEAHEILAYLNTALIQATGGWKARGRHLRSMLVAHIETLEHEHERRSQVAAKKKPEMKKVDDGKI